MPFLVIDDDGPARAARMALLRGGAAARRSDPAGANERHAMIADTCMRDAASTARIRELMQGAPTARFVARSHTGAMAPIRDAPDFQAMADRLAK